MPQRPGVVIDPPVLGNEVALLASATTSPQRDFLLDLLKAVACVLIVWHHLAFYGPMSDATMALAPSLLAWLYNDGRMAVQVFLVVAGYLVAGQMGRTLNPVYAVALPHTAQLPALLALLSLLLRRYGRLVLPLLAALCFSVLAAALVRPWLHHASVSGPPSLAQLLAHAALLQDLLGIEALSAGVWYVAIDLQLFALALVLCGVCMAVKRRWPAQAQAVWLGLVGLLTALSLLWWNRLPGLDTTALYFFGAYGLGMLAHSAGPDRPAKLAMLGALVLVGGLALALDFRARIGVALATAVLLALWGGGRATGPASVWRRAVAGLAKISYSVFLIHFSVSLLVSAVVHGLWPGQPWINAIGMAASFVLSVVAGLALYRVVERPAPNQRRFFFWLGLLVLSGAAVGF